MSVETNPYTPPGAPIEARSARYRESELAGRGERLAAAMIDNALYFLPLLPGFALIGAAGGDSDSEAASAGFTVFSLGFLVTLALTVYQWVLLSTRGQTLGKRWMAVRVRVVLLDGQPASFASAVLVRNWVSGLIQAIPLVGPVFFVVDALCIFGADRRCVHDLMAGTKVVTALDAY